MDAGVYTNAMMQFCQLNDFQDSKILAEECKPLLYESAINEIIGSDYTTKDYTLLHDALSYIKDYEDTDQYLKMIDGIVAFKQEQYKEAFEIFKGITPEFVSKYTDWYEGWYSASIYMYVFHADKLTINEAMELYSMVPDSHLADNKEFFEVLPLLEKCTGKYRREKDLTEKTIYGPYYLNVNSFWMEEGSIMVDVQYDANSSTLEIGTVGLLNDVDYNFVISTSCYNSYSNTNMSISIKIGPSKAYFQNITGSWGEVCVRE